MDGYATKISSLFITSKPLRRKEPTQQYLDTVRYYNTHNFSVQIVDGEPVVTVTDKE